MTNYVSSLKRKSGCIEEPGIQVGPTPEVPLRRILPTRAGTYKVRKHEDAPFHIAPLRITGPNFIPSCHVPQHIPESSPWREKWDTSLRWVVELVLQSNRIAARNADLVYFPQEEVQPRQCQSQDEDGMDVDSEVPIPFLPNVTILVYGTPVGDAWRGSVPLSRSGTIA